MKNSFITLANGILIFLLIFAFHPQVVFADDGTPTTDETVTEEAPPPDEGVGESKLQEEPEVDKSETIEKVSPTDEGTEDSELFDKSEVPEVILPENPSGEESQPVSTPEQEEALEQQSESVSEDETPEITPVEVLEQAPEGTQIVVLDEDGQVEPLASQEAAAIVSKGDPMWCPSGTLPGGAGCSGSYTSFKDLLVDLGSFSGDGTIYVANTYDSALESDDITIGGNFYTALGALTIQGGWDGVLGADNIIGTSTFDGVSLAITNWIGPVTIRDIRVINTLYGLEIDTTGAVTLNNVEVTDTSSNNGIDIQAGGDVNLNDVESSSNIESGADIRTTSGNVSISNSTFNNNAGASYSAGVEIASPGTVTLSNVTANSNQDDGIAISNSPEIHLNNVIVDNNGWDGAYVDGLCSKVYVNHGTFTNNGFINPLGGYGVEVDNGNIYQSGTPVFANNFSGATKLDLDPCFFVPPTIKEVKPRKTSIPFTISNGELTSLSCLEPVTTLITPEDTRATFKNFCNYQVIVFDESSNDLISRLPALELPYYSGVTITILYEGNEIIALPDTSDIVLSFRISDEELDQEYAVYHWDGTNWIEVSNIRKVYDRVEVMTRSIGTFVLVMKQ